eukprot:99822_1
METGNKSRITNKCDKEQMQILFDTIKCTDSITNINICDNICILIAECAVGYTANCEKEDCDDKAVILFNDLYDGSFVNNKYYECTSEKTFCCQNHKTGKNWYCHECNELGVHDECECLQELEWYKFVTYEEINAAHQKLFCNKSK